MEYQLDIGETVELEIVAREIFSKDYITVELGQSYEFNASKTDKWTDWFILTNADGFSNMFLWNKNKRVSGQKCFKLCGTIELNEDNHFSIGTHKILDTTESGDLHFFANDSKNLKYYRNNKGSIKLLIKRLK